MAHWVTAVSCVRASQVVESISLDAAAAIARGLGMEVPVAAVRGEQGGAQERV